MIRLLAAAVIPTALRTPPDDAATVRDLAAGDERALAALYDRHSRPIYSLALRILGDQADAEDVLQEVFAQAWRQATRYDSGRGPVAAWLLTMTRTRAIDRLRARQARPDSHAPTAPVEDVRPDLAWPADDPVLAIDAAQDALRVRAALNGLPVLQRLAIELAYFEGMTQSEIAERLEQPLGTVKTRIRQGLIRLREMLSGHQARGPA